MSVNGSESAESFTQGTWGSSLIPILSLLTQLPSLLIQLPWYFSHQLLLPFPLPMPWFRSSLLLILTTNLPAILLILSPCYCQNDISKMNLIMTVLTALRIMYLVTTCVTLSKLLNISCLCFLTCKIIVPLIIVPLIAVGNIKYNLYVVPGAWWILRTYYG